MSNMGMELFLAVFLAAAAAGGAFAGYPSATFDGAKKVSADPNRPAVYAGDKSDEGEQFALKAAGYADPQREYGGYIPNPSSKPKRNPFWQDFFGGQFNAATGAAFGLGAALGLIAGIATLNPVAGFIVFAAASLLFSFVFNFLK